MTQNSSQHTNLNLNKRSILKKTIQVGSLTLLSRAVAIARELLKIRFLGIGIISDAFIIAFRIPNLFRHIFAEGALSAAFVPVIVKTVKENKRETANGLMSLSFIVFQSVILLIYLFVFLKTDLVVKLLAPGFNYEQAQNTVLFLRILFPFLFLASSSALLAGALNAVNHFAVPAFGPALWNIVYVASLILCLTFKLSPLFLCWAILFAGVIQLLLHVLMFFMYHFKFGVITPDAIRAFKQVIKKFLPCLLGVSIVEINFFVSGIVASFLPKGSVSILYYGCRFMNIPLGVFAVAFSSILLPHFSRIVLYAPKRLNFYILEVAKFVSWVIIPISLFMIFVSHNVFALFLAHKATPAQITQAGFILIIYSLGLLFFALNKALLNIFYALKDTRTTMIISSISALVNLVGDVIGMLIWGIYGIAGAACLSGLVMTVLCIFFLHKKHNFVFYTGNYLMFLTRLVPHILITSMFFLACFYGIQVYTGPLSIIKYWLIILPIGLISFLFFFFTKKLFRINAYFLK